MNANSDTMLIEPSSGTISTKAPRNEMGMPMVVQKARRRSTNRTSTPNTSTSPIRPLRSRSSMRLRRMSARLSQTEVSMPVGSARFSR